jgi:hypothetical protein
VHTANENGLDGHDDSSAGQQFAYTAIVEYLRQRPGVRPAPRTSACPTVMSRLVRIIHAGRSVAQEEHQGRESRSQADLAQNLFRDRRHFVESEPTMASIRQWFRIKAFEHEPRERGLHKSAQVGSNACSQAGKERPRHEWNRREYTDHRSQHRANPD